jgi:hypothetical protein
MCNNEQETLAKYRVTSQQLDQCSRWVDEQSHTILYLVQSASTPDLTYQVKWNRQFSRFACDPRCPASASGTVCWHLRAAFASETLYQQAKLDEEQAAERERLDAMPPLVPDVEAERRDMERCQSHPFSLLR